MFSSVMMTVVKAAERCLNSVLNHCVGAYVNMCFQKYISRWHWCSVFKTLIWLLGCFGPWWLGCDHGNLKTVIPTSMSSLLQEEKTHWTLFYIQAFAASVRVPTITLKTVWCLYACVALRSMSNVSFPCTYVMHMCRKDNKPEP